MAAAQREREPCVVVAAPLAALVRSFVSRWNIDRPPLPPNPHAGAPVQPVGAVAWLSQETGISKETIDKLLAGRRSHVGLGTADALLQAIDRPDALWNQEVPVTGNPHGGLRFARARAGQRVAYAARIQLAGHDVGRVRRFRAAARYLAFDADGRVVADAPTIDGLRRELQRRNVGDAYCCGGSLTGAAQPRQAASLNGSFSG